MPCLYSPEPASVRESTGATNSPGRTPARGLGRDILVLCAALAAACGIIFRDFLRMEKVYLFKDIGSDSLNIFFPWLVHLSDYIRVNGIPSWTFAQGLGQNVFPFWVGDFFSDFLMIFVSRQFLPYGLVWMEVLKIVLCGVMFYAYLRELKLDGFAAGLGAFLYALCGYVVLGGCWTIFSVEALYAATILYGFERWLNRGRWLWYVVGLSCMSLLQPFFLFLYSLFLVTYIPLRYAEVYPERRRRFPSFILKTLGLSALGVAASAWQLLPDVLQYLESPRGGGDAGFIRILSSRPVFALADDMLLFTTTFRAFGSDMLGTGSFFRGWSNYLEAPLFYCGLLCLVTFPQLVATRPTRKLKVLWGLFTCIWFIPLIFPYFRYAFWAFSGDYFRTLSLLITVILIVSTAKALQQIMTTGKLNRLVLVLTLGSLLCLLYIPPARYAAAVDSSLRTTASLLLGIYSVLLLVLAGKAKNRRITQAILAVCCLAELVYFSCGTVNGRAVVTVRELGDIFGGKGLGY